MSKSKILEELRLRIKHRANYCCEYCLMNSAATLIPFHVDHIISEKQGGSSTGENLCYACAACNRYKGASIVAYDRVSKSITMLFNPREDTWSYHFKLLASGKIEAKTKTGEGTIKILQINRLNRIRRRKSQMDIGLM